MYYYSVSTTCSLPFPNEPTHTPTHMQASGSLLAYIEARFHMWPCRLTGSRSISKCKLHRLGMLPSTQLSFGLLNKLIVFFLTIFVTSIDDPKFSHNAICKWQLFYQSWSHLDLEYSGICSNTLWRHPVCLLPKTTFPDCLTLQLYVCLVFVFSLYKKNKNNECPPKT